MTSWQQFLETKDTTKIDCITDMAESLRDVFKRYTLTTRKEAWKKITGKKGEELVQEIIRTPTRSLSKFRTLVP